MLPFLRQPFPNRCKRARQAFVDWLASPKGVALLEAETRQLQDLLPSLVGCRALQVGVGGEIDLLASCHLPYHWYLASTRVACADMQIYPANLPLASQSVDLVLLHHCLDFDDAPYRIISEAVRLLNPGGSLLVVGFNPFSLLGLQHLLAASRHPLHGARFLRAGRVCDWVGVSGCEVQGYVAGFAAHHERGYRALLRQQLWRRFGGFYVLMARKQAVPLHPILTRRQRLTDLPPNVIIVPAARWQRTGHSIETGNHI